nr:hypothetical protein CFP56_03889 [Quercus suber]
MSKRAVRAKSSCARTISTFHTAGRNRLTADFTKSTNSNSQATKPLDALRPSGLHYTLPPKCLEREGTLAQAIREEFIEE